MPRKTRHTRTFRFEQLENRYLLTTLSVNGDYNQDGLVNAADYTVWRDSIAQTGAGLPADGNGDAVVTQLDQGVWHQNFGNVLGASSSLFLTALSEPGRQGLVIVGTTGPDNVLVEQFASILRATVQIAGGGHDLFEFDATTIDQIYFRGYEGNDRFENLVNVSLTAFGDSGDDTLIGGPNADALYGDVGNDTLYGNDGDDYLVGEDEEGAVENLNDVIVTGEGQDTIVSYIPNLDTEGSLRNPFNLLSFGTIDLNPQFQGSGWNPVLRAEVTKALADLSSHLVASYAGETIDIQFSLVDSFDRPTTVAASEKLHHKVNGTYFTPSLINHMAGRNETGFEIVIKIRLDWAAPGQEFRGTITHEVTHGLGFDGHYTNLAGIIGSTPFTRQIVTSNGRQLTSDIQGLRDGMDGATPIDMYWTGPLGSLLNNGTRPQIYSPIGYIPGSSISHVDDWIHDDAVMSPDGSTETEHLSAYELGMLADIGWNIDPERDFISNPQAMVAIGSKLFFVADDDLWSYDSSTETFDVLKLDDWPNLRAMAPLGDRLYMVADDGLWWVSSSSGTPHLIKSADWSTVQAMVTYNDRLYMVETNGDLLWVNPASGTTHLVKAGDWPDLRAMVVLNDRFYMVADGGLWWVNPSSGTPHLVKSGNWSTVEAMVPLNDRLYMIESDGDVSWVNPASGTTHLIKNDAWRDLQTMTTLNGRLYVMQDNELWWINPDSGTPHRVHFVLGDQGAGSELAAR
ncbi:MAG: hypothetical protein WD851_05005 [Pirellulales bacterium]